VSEIEALLERLASAPYPRQSNPMGVRSHGGTVAALLLLWVGCSTTTPSLSSSLADDNDDVDVFVLPRP
jgi:hypothetical protein